MKPLLRAAVPGLFAAALVAAVAAPAFADNSNKIVLGLDMSFGDRVTPEVFAGIAHANTSASGDVSGAKALMYWDFRQNLAPSKFKVLGIFAGRRNWQPELGAGYSFENQGGFFTGGISGNHFTGGVDFSPKAGLSPYVGVQVPGKY